MLLPPGPRWLGFRFSFRLELSQSGGPESVDELPEPSESGRIRPVQPPGALAPLCYQPSRFEDAQVLGDRWPCYRELRGDLASGKLTVAHEL